ncbi:MAG: hypothetical protein PHU25_02050 [Deltaproteobacteria bacterium]|nr:hypothetical protein [Deltaproteobacteria bacterium]
MTPEEVDKMLDDLEHQLERLQALYNQYFMGIERLEPTVPRKEVERKVQALRREQLRNTAQRFRFQTQVQKFNTQSIYWRRICKQIEEGTYKRDVMRAQKRIEKAEGADRVERPMAGLSIDVPFSESDDIGERASIPTPAARPAACFTLPSDLDIDEPFADAAELERVRRVATLDAPFGDAEMAPAPSAPPVPRPSSKAPMSKPAARPQSKPAPAAKTGLSEERLQSIYRAYLTARKRCNEPTDNVSYDKLAGSLRKQAEAKGQGVDFKVVIREGKAMIKLVKS